MLPSADILDSYIIQATICSAWKIKLYLPHPFLVDLGTKQTYQSSFEPIITLEGAEEPKGEMSFNDGLDLTLPVYCRNREGSKLLSLLVRTRAEHRRESAFDCSVCPLSTGKAEVRRHGWSVTGVSIQYFRARLNKEEKVTTL